jgi:peptidoglycan/xylan/chitin deacetylase (PgdA/CDA1 family)
MLEVEKMKGSKRALIRRIIIRGLLVMAVILCTMLLLSKNNLPAAATQDLPVPEVKPVSTSPAVPARAMAPAGVSLSRSISSSGAAGITAAAGKPAVSQTSALQKTEQTTDQKAKQKTVYLTFDDGPSNVTPSVLETLRKHNVKATFFVLGEQAKSHPELINAIWEQGHVIGNHTYNHNYHDLYSGFTEFWNQIKQTEEVLREITGIRPQLVRAPGGTYGHFDDTYFGLMKEAGYTVMDWTVDSGDSRRKGVPAADILRDSVPSLKASRVILLLHDGAGHSESAKALPEIIARYKAAGYTFGVLDAGQEPVQFRVSAAAAAGRSKPSNAWIASNILPNAGLFAPGKPLVLEVGMLEAKLAPGEFRISGGQYMVPLRAVIERLGGQVSWDSASRSGSILWNGRNINADTVNKQLTLTSDDGISASRESDVQMIGASLWLPLRELLEAAGHPLLEVKVTAEERRVKAR